MKIKLWLLAYVETLLGCRINPLELLRRPFFHGPASVRTTAGPQQFAGRTALASGTASVTVSTAVVNSDSIIFHSFQANTTTAGSGTQFSTVVSSIVSGISFALGTADGQGRQPGGTFMWEIRRTS